MILRQMQINIQKQNMQAIETNKNSSNRKKETLKRYGVHTELTKRMKYQVSESEDSENLEESR